MTAIIKECNICISRQPCKTNSHFIHSGLVSINCKHSIEADTCECRCHIVGIIWRIEKPLGAFIGAVTDYKRHAFFGASRNAHARRDPENKDEQSNSRTFHWVHPNVSKTPPCATS